MAASGRRESLVFATSNRGKLLELRALLDGIPIDVFGVSEVLRHPPEVVEDGVTFAENAMKKAATVSRATMMLTLADDSGLEVGVLEGRPGVMSARFAHVGATDAENNAALLAALDAAMKTGANARGEPSARFRCALVLLDPFALGAAPHTVEGVCEGTIVRAPRGSGGFGYDPLFVASGMDRTMAELTPAEKNRVSHRARALAALRPLIDRVIEERAGHLAMPP